SDPSAPSVDRLAALGSLVSPEAPWEPAFFAGVPEHGPSTGVVGADLRLSPSQATLYDQCPRRYVLDRRLRAIDTESPYLAFGSIIHEVLELAERQALSVTRPHAQLEQALLHLDSVWAEKADFGTPEVNRAWYRRAHELLAEIYGNWPGGDEPPVALELDMAASIGGVDWIGRADRVDRADGGVKVVDYKTSRTPPNLKEAGSSLQLGFYLLAAAEHPRLREAGPPVAAELWYPLARSSRKTFPFDMEQLDKVREALDQVARNILAEDWTPKVGRHCDRCDFRRVCPAWPEGRSI
ncbi:MAG: PD-(D/E)XK nuclease family protein, partial [Acidimicrobiia bacterium]